MLKWKCFFFSGSSLENLSRTIGTQTPTEEGRFEFPEPGQVLLDVDDDPDPDLDNAFLEDSADEPTPLLPFNADLSNARKYILSVELNWCGTHDWMGILILHGILRRKCFSFKVNGILK